MKRLTTLGLSVALLAGFQMAYGQYTLTPVVTGLTVPVAMVQPPAETNRIFIIEQRFAPTPTTGRIRIFKNGALLPTPFLSVPNVGQTGEQGLLGLAFHPNYAQNGQFFIYYIRQSDGASVLERVQVDPGNPDVALASSRDPILVIPQPFANHNGGTIHFTPEGYLMIGMGDGGFGGDPGDRAQNPNELLGKMLRIDVDGDDFPADANRDYRIPPGNAYPSGGGAPEIWALGLRNPWMHNFDFRSNNGLGGLTIADVGESSWEEMNYAPGHIAGLNYGWRVREGMHDTGRGGIGVGQPMHDPFAEYAYSAASCSILGGEIVRDARLGLEMWGEYVFSDHCGGWLRSYGLELNPETSELVSVSPSPRELGTPVIPFGSGIRMLNDRKLYVSIVNPAVIYRLDAVNPSRKLNGTVTFSDVVGAPPLAVTFEYVHATTGAVLGSIQVGIPENGQFEVPAPTENMTVKVSGGTWLRKGLPADTRSSDIGGLNFILINGDVDGDNEVGAADLSILSSAFLTGEGDPAFVAEADLDRDGEVGAADLSILSTNFLVSGD